MSLLNRPAEYDHLYDTEGRLQGGLSALEELAQVIAMNSGGDRDQDGMDDEDEDEWDDDEDGDEDDDDEDGDEEEDDEEEIEHYYHIVST